MKRYSLLFLWLGAAISISEIYTGGLIAPLGLREGAIAIILGHIIGVALLAFGSFISRKQGTNAMESATRCFGAGGGRIIAACNTVQLAGWTVVMNVQGASAITSVFPRCPFTVAALALALLVLVWALFLGSPAMNVNTMLVPVLALLCIFFFAQCARQGGGAAGIPPLATGMSFALAMELSISMPVSWLPVAGDYSGKAGSAAQAFLMPFIGYGAGSVVMNLLGLYLRLKTGKDIFAFLPQSGFPLIACVIIVLSTITTAFLDLYSAAESSREAVPQRKPGRSRLLTLGVLTIALSACFPMERYGDFLTAFLTAIGSVFTPVYTVLFLDFLTARRGSSGLHGRGKLVAAALGIIVYQVLSHTGFAAPTLATMAFTACAWFIGRKINNGLHG
jgi:putative hydroxymethylpyrimidine transporter CytX